MLPGVFIEVFLSGRSIWFFCIIGRGKGICRYSLVISNFYVRYEAVEWKLYFPYYSRYLLYSLYFTGIICERWFYASCTYGFCFYAILLVYYYFICIYVVAQIHNICMFFLSKLFNLLPDFGIFGFSGDSATVDWTGWHGIRFCWSSRRWNRRHVNYYYYQHIWITMRCGFMLFLKCWQLKNRNCSCGVIIDHRLHREFISHSTSSDHQRSADTNSSQNYSANVNLILIPQHSELISNEQSPSKIRYYSVIMAIE